MNRTTLTILLVVLGLSALIVMAQVEPLDFEQAPDQQQSNAAPPVRPVEVVNFPDPQNVAGTVSVSNLPSVQSVSGTVEIGNLATVQEVSGQIDVGNFPTTAEGSLLVAPASITHQVFELLSSEIVLEPFDSWESVTFDATQFTRMSLKVLTSQIPGYTQFSCDTLWQWTMDDDFFGGAPNLYWNGHGTGFGFASTDLIAGTQCKIVCSNNSSSGLAQPVTLKDVKVMLRRE